MKNVKEIYFDDENVMYRYSVTGGGSVRVIDLEKYEVYEEEEEYDEEHGAEYDEEEECLDEFRIIIAKADGYYLAFPDMGTASPGMVTLSNYGLIASLVHDGGYWNPDTEAITLAIMDVAESGF